MMRILMELGWVRLKLHVHACVMIRMPGSQNDSQLVQMRRTDRVLRMRLALPALALSLV